MRAVNCHLSTVNSLCLRGKMFDFITDTNTFKLIIPGQSPFRLFAQSKNEFLIDDEIKVEFVWDESNKLKSVIIYQHGIKSYQGNKVK